MPERYVRRWRWVYASVFAPIVAIVLSLAVLQLYPFDNIKIKGIFVADKTYHAGDIVIIMADNLCWDGIEFTSQRWLVTGTAQSDIGFVRQTGYPPNVTPGKDGCFTTPYPVARVQIPYDTIPGEHKMLFEITYRPVPFHEEQLELQTNPFVVVG